MQSIEFIGIPGSGKSTLCNHLIRDDKFIYSTDLVLKKYYYRINPIINTIYYLLLKNRSIKNFLKRNFHHREGGKQISLFHEKNRLFFKHINESKSFIQQSEEDKNIILLLLNKFIIEYQYCHSASNKKVVIFEEGFMHKALSLFNGINNNNDSDKIESACINDITKYLDLVPNPEILCIINISIDKSFHRLKKRGMTKRLKFTNDNVIKDYLSKSQTLISIIKENKIKSNCKIIELENNNDIQSFINQFEKKIV